MELKHKGWLTKKHTKQIFFTTVIALSSISLSYSIINLEERNALLFTIGVIGLVMGGIFALATNTYEFGITDRIVDWWDRLPDNGDKDNEKR